MIRHISKALIVSKLSKLVVSHAMVTPTVKLVLPFTNFLTFSILIIVLNKFSFACNFKSIISFGDSLADTGNAIYLSRSDSPPFFFTLLPYGETYFHHPTGRSSDGRLIIDFLAEEFGLPLVTPYYGVNRSSSTFVDGVNFAVFGAKVLDDSFFNERGIQIPIANVSLGVQIGWFKQFLSAFCNTSTDCKRFIQTSLILMGEIGGNDYTDSFLCGKSEAEVQTFVPKVIKEIGYAINELINLGAVTIMVPGNFPIGCSAVYLTLFKNTSMAEDYDIETGCIKWLNIFAEYHNELLEMELKRIRSLHPHVTLIYADYYNAAMNLYRYPNKYGFEGRTLRACCGVGGPYNVDLYVKCGYSPSTSCEDPSSYVSWDGLHLTQAAYQWITKGLLTESYTKPPLTKNCTLPAPAGFYDH